MHTVVAVSFDLFGTLLDADRPENAAVAIATALRQRGVEPPADWETLFRQHHVEVPEGAELPLPQHVTAALQSEGIDPAPKTVEAAVLDAFTRTVQTRPGAVEAVANAAASDVVGVCSNCSVPGLVERALTQSDIDPTVFDAVVSSAASGWRKPHPRAFEILADQLAVPVEEITHIGDTSQADGGIEALGGTAIIIDSTTPITEVVPRNGDQT